MIKNSSIFPSNNLLNVTANYFTYTFSLWKYNVCSPLSPLVLAVQRAHHLIKRFLFISFSRLSQLPKPPLVFCGIILCSTNSQALISQASKVMLKILQARLQQYLNYELPDVQAGFRKGIGIQRSNCQHPLYHQKNQRVPKKHLFLLYWLCQSLWLCGSQ